ncbi:MAG: radical SAM protein [Firmicutes bacterium]|nr:radical SAM protein [Bacillota bacterium]
METRKKVAIITNNINCERNTQYYSMIEKYFRINNWDICDNFSVDKIIIVGCGFHDHMYEKVKKAIAETKNSKISEENIIIAGCVPKTHESLLEKGFQGKIVQYHQEALLDEIIAARVKFDHTKYINLFNVHDNSIINKECFYIKIAEGCLQQCTFCVIKKVKGLIKSRPVNEIIEQLKLGISQNYRNFFLMGEDTFAYGHDTGQSIIELVNSLLKINSNITLYFGSMHCKWLIKYAEDLLLLCKQGKIKTLHIGLQHVSNYVLKKMGRGVNFPEVYDIITNIKKINPDIYLSADILVGFPGESKEHFNELVEFFKNDQCFDRISHYGYSDVYGSESFNFADKIPQIEIGMRWNYLDKILGERSGYKNTFKSEKRLIDENDFYFCINTYKQ